MTRQSAGTLCVINGYIVVDCIYSSSFIHLGSLAMTLVSIPTLLTWLSGQAHLSLSFEKPPPFSLSLSLVLPPTSKNCPSPIKGPFSGSSARAGVWSNARIGFLKKKYKWVDIAADGRCHVNPEAEIGAGPLKVQELLEVPEAKRRRAFFQKSSLANSLTLDFWSQAIRERTSAQSVVHLCLRSSSVGL